MCKTFLLLLLVQLPLGRAYHYQAVTLLFPRLPVAEASALLHTPERWASGAGLLLSVPSFEISNAQQPLCLEEAQCVVRFHAHSSATTQWVQCYGRGPHRGRVSVGNLGCAEPHTLLAARVEPLQHVSKVGFALVLELRTKLQSSDWSLGECSEGLHVGLWPTCYGHTAVLRPELALYRKWVLGS